MKTRIITTVFLVPLFAVTSLALFDPTGPIQRAQMIVNQGIQIAHQVTSLATLDGQLTELTNQFQHLQDQALGTVGAITQPFTDLASVPTSFISSGLSWKSQFSGVAGEIVNSVEQMGQAGTSFTNAWQNRLLTSDSVAEADIVSFYQNYDPALGTAATDRYRSSREEGDKRLVLDHALSDAAAALITSAREASVSYEGLRNNTNTSNTALAQAQVSAQVTEGNLAAAVAQLNAYQAAKQAAEDYEREIARRERLTAWMAAQQQARAELNAQQANLDARRDDMREGLLFSPVPFYTGN